MTYDFSAVNAAMQKYVDREILSGVSTAVLVGRELVHSHCTGWADRESRTPMRDDHLFRVFSNTKLITSMAVLLLMEDGKLELDQPAEEFLPQLANRRVLRPGAASIDDTEAARSPITIRQLLNHSSGLSYGLLDHGTLMYKAYNERRVMNAFSSLADMMDVLAGLPLSFHPGTAWEYSIATDVLARLVEVVSGMSFDRFLQMRILNPLAMHDTGFVVPEHKRELLASYYSGADPQNILQRGLRKLDKSPYPGAFVTPVARLSGGGGLVSSMQDMLALMRSLMPDGDTLLRPDTIRLMMQNHLPSGTGIAFPGVGAVPGKGFGLGGAVTLQPSSIDPPAAAGEFEWGGIAGTHWWISPRHHIAGVLMTQRLMSFWHPFSFDFKRLAYEAVGHRAAV
ncbi:serine hydrolase domain-containing protein [Undibacterium sp. TS12]|uniref:serine hydrolase domain-containing protein n=1 Tax=Undibacterium sp. TS12 TaxID=2908202 RepID=UPI001F4CB0E1|nr:serine hydrolase domain-containing protein [Undibacterium sp. TS12]MCH8618097.1 beta-lactamase family protein [Undibacterium sp. TS12]